MENKETITTLKGVIEKESKAGRKYIVFQTSSVDMSCFESDVVAELKKHLDKRVRLEIAEKDNFINIKKFLGEVAEEKISGQAAPINLSSSERKQADSFEEARKLKDQSIYTSYAKDLFIACWPEVSKSADAKRCMESCIALIKQARDSF